MKNHHELFGRSVGGFRLTKILGQGGFGSSFVGVSDKNVERVVKIFDKLLPSDLEKMVRLNSPRVVRVDDVVDFDGAGALVLEYLHNGNLASLMRNPAFDVSDVSTAVPIVRQLLEALAQYHREGVVSGNVKLTNVLFDNNFGVKLSDMGLASFLPGKSELLDHPAFLQTLKYRDNSSGVLSFADDIYAVGGILNQLLTRRSPEDVITRSPIKGNVEVSTTLNHIVRVALDSQRSKRYESADAFLDALKYVSAPKVIVPSESLLDLDGGKKTDTVKVILPAPVVAPVIPTAYVADPTVEIPSPVASDTVRGMVEPDDVVLIEPRSHETVNSMVEPTVDDELDYVEQPRYETKQPVILPAPAVAPVIVPVPERVTTPISLWSILGTVAVSAAALCLPGCNYSDFKERPAIVAPVESVSPVPSVSPSPSQTPSPLEVVVSPSPVESVSPSVISDTFGVRVVSRFRFGYSAQESAANVAVFKRLNDVVNKSGKIDYAISLDVKDGHLDGVIDPKVLRSAFDNAYSVLGDSFPAGSVGNESYYEFSKVLLFDSASLRPYFLNEVSKIPVSTSLIISCAPHYSGSDEVFNLPEAYDFLNLLRAISSSSVVNSTDVVVPSEVVVPSFVWVAPEVYVEVPDVRVEVPVVPVPREEFIAYLTASFEFDVVNSEQKSIVHSLNYLRGGDMFRAIASATDVDTDFEKLQLALHLDGLDGGVDDFIHQSSMSSFILDLPDELRRAVYAAIPSVPADAAEEFDLVLPEDRMSLVVSNRFIFYSQAERDAFYSLIGDSSGWRSYGSLLDAAIAQSGDGVFDGNEFSNLEAFLYGHFNYKLLGSYPSHYTSGAVESEADFVANNPARVSGVRKYFILKITGSYSFVDDKGNPSSERRDLFLSSCSNNTDELLSAQLLDGNDGSFDGVVRAAYLSEFAKARAGTKNSNPSDIGDGSTSNDLYLAIKFYDKAERDTLARSLKSLDVSSGTLLFSLVDPVLDVSLNYDGVLKAYNALVELQKKLVYKSNLSDNSVKP